VSVIRFCSFAANPVNSLRCLCLREFIGLDFAYLSDDKQWVIILLMTCFGGIFGEQFNLYRGIIGFLLTVDRASILCYYIFMVLITSDRYVQADSWMRLARAVRLSTSGSHMDELIQVIQEDKPIPKAVDGVRFVSLKDRDILRSLYDRNAPTAHRTELRIEQPHSGLNVNAPQFVPAGIHLFKVLEGRGSVEPGPTSNDPGSHDASSVHTEEDSEQGDVEEIKFEARIIAESEDVEELALSNGTTPAIISPSAEELHAAKVILEAYKRASNRRFAQDGSSGAQAMHIAAFRTYAKKLEWPNQCYRFLFLGPLPHLLVCVDAIHDHHQFIKGRIKKRFKAAQHGELEDLSKQQTEVR
jgi:hypothetical protein